jgi:hypothetical protein
MKANLITFADIRERAAIDVTGGIVEVPSAGTVLRGTIEDIFWWPSHPSRIEWTDGIIWDQRFGTWNKSTNGRINFPLEGAEYFGGPYEMESREIFFIFNNVLCLTIFPVGFEPPELPYDNMAGYAIHCRIMGLNPHGRAIA